MAHETGGPVTEQTAEARATGSAAARGPDDWLVSHNTRAALSELDAIMRASVRSAQHDLRQVASHLVDRPGKRLRPALVLLAAEFGRGDRQRLAKAAAGIELLHIGSLYHDDIMDRAALRRGAAAASHRWGEPLASVAGTYVTAAAIALLAVDEAVMPLVSAALLELCTGQLQEAQNAFDMELPLEEHLAIISRKTASLFELPCRVGAALAGVATEQTAALGLYGRHLGIAFQIADDALDLGGVVTQTGKLLRTDLRQGVYALPILLAVHSGQQTGRYLAERLRKTRLDDAELERVVQILQEAGVVAEALAIAGAHRDKAITALEPLPAGPARDSLERLAEYATTRTG